MEPIELTQAQEDLIRHAIRSGRITSAEDAVAEALLLWEDRERHRMDFLDTLDAAEASLGRGEGMAITQESMQSLAEDVKRRGRERLAAERLSQGG